MKICVASNNQAKIDAVISALSQLEMQGEVCSAAVPSGVSPQPFSIAETRAGAINRAMKALGSSDVSIGLEGGVFDLDGTLYLCSWGALVTQRGGIFTAGGAQLPLPKEIEEPLRQGAELGPVMDVYAKEEGIRFQKGAIGILSGGKLDRVQMFAQIVVLLLGQFETDSD